MVKAKRQEIIDSGKTYRQLVTRMLQSEWRERAPTLHRGLLEADRLGFLAGGIERQNTGLDT